MAFHADLINLSKCVVSVKLSCFKLKFHDTFYLFFIFFKRIIQPKSIAVGVYKALDSYCWGSTKHVARVEGQLF